MEDGSSPAPDSIESGAFSSKVRGLDNHDVGEQLHALHGRILALVDSGAFQRLTPEQLRVVTGHTDDAERPVVAARELRAGVPQDVWAEAWQGAVAEVSLPRLRAIEAMLTEAMASEVEPIPAKSWPPLQHFEAALAALCQAPDPVPEALVDALAAAAREVELHPLPGAQRPKPPLPPTRPRSGRPNLPDNE